MGDDAEYFMEQQEIEAQEREAQRQARIDEDARRNRKWAKAAAGAKTIPAGPEKR